LNAGNPGASYSWTSTNGFTSAQQSVEITQAGDYSLTISNAFGCAKTKTFRVDVSADSFKGDFLVSSVVNVGDTVYVIDISKPVPTAVNWFLPSQARVISTNDNNSIKQVVFEATGDYTITMNASRGECSEGITKSVKVIEKANKEATNLALGYKDELVKKLTVFPNPSSGQFTVGVELSSTENVRIRLIGLSSNQLIETKEAAGKKLYEVPFNHPELNPGIYFVTVEAGTAVKTLKIIIL
jgi:hypothetical protein